MRVFEVDYPATQAWKRQMLAMSRRVAAAGEPFRTFFDPPSLCARLAQIGFRSIEDLGPDELNTRCFQGRTDGLRVSGHLGRVMSVEV